MGSTFVTRNRILSIIWWTKVFIAFALSAGGLIGLSVNVLLKHKAPQENPNVAKPIVISPDNPVCSSSKSPLARVEPPNGKVYLGFDVTWNDTKPRDVTNVMGGKIPAIFGAFMDLDQNAPTQFDFNMLADFGFQTQLQGSILLLTLQPTSECATIPQSLLDDLARAFTEINSKGVPILLRWGHEMNGDWTTYGVRPVNYVTSFQRMARTVRRFTNLTAMVWGPNVGIQYPFNNMGELQVVDLAARRFRAVNPTGRYPTSTSDPINFRALDTNRNGLIDVGDDPYSPYYPGDEWVDWVGLSLYYYANDEGTINRPVPPTYFEDHLRGYGPSIAEVDGPIFVDQPDRRFYDTYVAAKGKPFIIPETAVPWYPNRANTATITEATMKQQWWSQILSPKAFAQFPQMKAAAIFEERKPCDNGQTCDYRVLTDPNTRSAFLADTAPLSNRLVYANQLGFDCAGQLTLKP